MLLVVIGYCKPVHLLLYARNKGKSASVGIDFYFAAVKCNGSCSVPVVLYHTENRNVDVHFFDNRQNSVHLRLTAVKQNKVR